MSLRDHPDSQSRRAHSLRSELIQRYPILAAVAVLFECPYLVTLFLIMLLLSTEFSLFSRKAVNKLQSQI